MDGFYAGNRFWFFRDPLLSGLEFEEQGGDGDERGTDDTDSSGAGPTIELDVEVGAAVEIDVRSRLSAGDDRIHILNLLVDNTSYGLPVTVIIIWRFRDKQMDMKKVFVTPVIIYKYLIL